MNNFNNFCCQYKQITYFTRIYSSSSRVFFKMTDVSSESSISSKTPEIKTFVFLDTETTGLPKYENNQTRITELCMIAVQAKHIRLGTFPRVQNTLTLCFNPWRLISSFAEEITGLSNYLLEDQCKFSSETVDAINSFLNHNAKPICFVAHNGDYFDYPILHSEINGAGGSLVEDILCIDSMKAFRDIFEAEDNELTDSQLNTRGVFSCDLTSPLTPFEFTEEYNEVLCALTDEVDGELPKKMLEMKKCNETTPKRKSGATMPSGSTQSKSPKIESSKNIQFRTSLKLTDVYTRLTKRPPIHEHQAQGDVNMLIACAATLANKFVDWTNTNSKKFSDIPSMITPKKIGS